MSIEHIESEEPGLPTSGKTIEITPGGRGAYGCGYGPTLLTRTAKGRLLLIADRWCGDNYEGSCYRPFAVEITEEEAELIVAAVAHDEVIRELVVGDWVRVSAAPAWVRSVCARAAKSVKS